MSAGCLFSLTDSSGEPRVLLHQKSNKHKNEKSDSTQTSANCN